MTVHLWRVACDTPSWTADDLSGKGAVSQVARWNQLGEMVICAATSISLAAWETRSHFARGAALPWNADLTGLKSRRSALLAVPSVVVAEENNVVLHLAQPRSVGVSATRVRHPLYDHRV